MTSRMSRPEMTEVDTRAIRPGLGVRIRVRTEVDTRAIGPD